MKNRKAFTLAEVTVVLAILGIIATITISSVHRNVQKSVFVIKAKDTYSMLDKATKMWMAENGCNDDISRCMKKAGTSPAAFDGIAQYLRVNESTSFQQSDGINGAKMCGGVACNGLNVSWLPAETTLYNGSKQEFSWQGVSLKGGNASRYNNYGADERGTTGFYLLKSGVTISVQAPDNGKVSGFGFFDVNGKKGGNRVGIDVFPFGLGMPYKNSNNAVKEGQTKQYVYNTYGLYAKGLNPYYTEDNNSNAGGLCRTITANTCRGQNNSPLEYVILHGKLPPLP